MQLYLYIFNFCDLNIGFSFDKLHQHQNRILEHMLERLQKLRARRAVKLFKARHFPFLAENARKQSIFSDRDNLHLRRQ